MKVQFCTLKVYFCTLNVYFCTLKVYYCTLKVLLDVESILVFFESALLDVERILFVHCKYTSFYFATMLVQGKGGNQCLLYKCKPPCCWGCHLRLFFLASFLLSNPGCD